MDRDLHTAMKAIRLAARMLALAPLAAFGLTPEQDAGRALAGELRQHRPSEGFTNSARLKLRDPSGKRTAVPVAITTRVSSNGWTVNYAAEPGAGRPGETLTIFYSESGPPRYEMSRKDPSGTPLPPTAMAAGEAFAPFAGTGFWIADLGREFLHWPEQRLLRREPHSGRMCSVLESTNPSTGGYARVVSWIDAEYHGILGAEAYDASGKLLKSFATGSIVRHGENYVLKDIKIMDRKTSVLTELEFENP